MVKLTSKLPKHISANGLDSGEAGFLARPTEQVVVVAYLSTKKVEIDYDDGGRVPTVMVDAVEIIRDPMLLSMAKRVFEETHDRRVNAAPTLPDASPLQQQLQNGAGLLGATE